MILPFLLRTVKNRTDEANNHSLISIHEPEHDTMEGSEFLDDAIRTVDQPLTDTEENTTSRPGDPL